MSKQRLEQLAALQERIEYRFSDITLLDTALTHTSCVKGDGKGLSHNERLEYLGDAVLELCVTEQIYRQYPKWSEGTMTRARASIVCEPALYSVAKELALQQYLLLGHGEELTGGRDKPSILSDALEALIGAIYLDGGYGNASAFILRFSKQMLADAAENSTSKDDKSMLQEYVQKNHLGQLQYKLIAATGPDHKKTFQMQVSIENEMLGEGIGKSKQEAGQHAAREALAKLTGKAGANYQKGANHCG